MNHAWTLTKMRVRLATRNRAFFFFSFVMPLMFLFGAVVFFARGSSGRIAYVLGAVLTLTVMGSFWGLSVQLVTFREQGILRRFRLAPVGAGAMLVSSILSNYFLSMPVIVLEVILCRYAFHLHSWGNLWAIFALVTLGSAAFAAFGEERLGPAMAKLGIEAEVIPSFHEAHEVFLPEAPTITVPAQE